MQRLPGDCERQEFGGFRQEEIKVGAGISSAIAIDDEANVIIKMTLTSPACPVAGSLPPEVEAKVASINKVNSAKIELVWSPPWDKDMMSEVAKLDLGFL